MTSLNPRNLLKPFSALLAAGCFLATLCTLNSATVFKEVASYPGYPRGPIVNAKVVGEYAYLASDFGGLIILDISDPTRPVKIGQCDTPGYISNVEVVGNIVYGVANTGLQVIDISDRSSPRLVKEVQASQSKDFQVHGAFGYLSSSFAISIFNLSNPLNPTFVTGNSFNGGVSSFMVVGDYIYIAQQSSGFTIASSTNGSRPMVVSRFDTAGTAMKMTVRENLAYIADGNALRIVDISDKLQPREVGSLPIAQANDVKIVGNLAYVAEGKSGVTIVDISIPTSPKLLGSSPVQVHGRSLQVEGNLAFLTTLKSFEILNVANPAGIQHMGSFYEDGYAWNLDSDGTRVYLADQAGGVKVFDVSEPRTPKFLGQSTNTQAFDLQVVQNTVYLADGLNGLKILDVTDPTKIRELGSYSAKDLTVSEVAVDKATGIAICRNGNTGFSIIELNDPQNLVFHGVFDTPSTVSSVKLSGNLAIIADTASGLLIYNVTDPSKPQLIGNYDTAGSASDLKVQGSLVFVADGTNGLQIINISNPASPALVGSFNTVSASRLALLGNKVYLTEGLRFHVLDVSDPTKPTRIGNYATPAAREVIPVGDLLYFADAENGLKLIEVKETEVFLQIKRVGDQTQLVWPNYNAPVRVQKSLSLNPPAWSFIPPTGKMVKDEFQVAVHLEGAQSYFRLSLQD